nr:immunoglobulin heavy chain junction region [Macaca mulatta]
CSRGNIAATGIDYW